MIDIKRVRGGHCQCNLAIIEELGDFFVESVQVIGEMLDQYVCPFIKALDIVVQVAEVAIPGVGKAITTGMRECFLIDGKYVLKLFLTMSGTAIASAKAFKYAYEGQDAAREWANYLLGSLGISESMGCGKVPSLGELMTAFVPFADARPDIYADFSTIPGGPGCRGKGRRGNRDSCNNDESNSRSPDQNTDSPGPTKSEKPKKSAQATSPPSDSKTSSTPSISSSSSLSSSTAPSSPLGETTISSLTSSTASASTIEDKKCTYYKPRQGNQRVMMREYSDFLRTVGDQSQSASKVVVQVRETGMHTELAS